MAKKSKKRSERGFWRPDGSWYVITNPRMDIGTREDGRIEKNCKHGVGHPVGHATKWEDWMGVHGCDGCCSRVEFYWEFYV